MKNKIPKIILLTQFYDPEPAYKGQIFAEAVRDLGYDVEVVTGFPNYPGGKLYDGFRIRPIQRTIINGIVISRLPLYPSHGTSKVGRIVNYLSFSLSAFIYLVFFAQRANLVYVYNPPLTIGLAATAARIIRRFPVVVDIHDLWPDTLPATGMITNPHFLRILDLAASWMYNNVQHIILHTEGFRKVLSEKNVLTAKMSTVLGWTNEYTNFDQQHSIPNSMSKLKGLKILYAGNIGPAQALESVLIAAYKLKQQGLNDLVTFCFLGDGVSLSKLKVLASNLELTNVLFLARVPANQVRDYLNAADALLVHLRDEKLFEVTLPSKTQAYMYTGKPVLMAVRGEASCLIEQAEAGIIATPEDPNSIADAAKSLASLPASKRNAMGRNGKIYYETTLSMQIGMVKFAKIFKKHRRK